MIQSYTKKIGRIDSTQLISTNIFKNKHQFFWENNKSEETIIAFGSILKIEIFNQIELNQISEKIKTKLNSVININKNLNDFVKIFGGYAFNIDKPSYDNWGDFPRGYFILPEYIITLKGKDTYITLLKKSDMQLDKNNFTNEIDSIYENLTNNQSQLNMFNNEIILNQDITKNEYLEMVSNIIKDIKLGSVKKVVLSRLKYLETKNVPVIINKICKEYPECINFFIKIPERGSFFGSTPERLIKKRKSLIQTEAIAGTIKRSNNNKDDKLLRKQLKNDSKSLEEHQLVVKEIYDILKKISSNIEIVKKPSVLKLKNIQHLITNIRGKLKQNPSILELVKILHPTPAVSGYPVNDSIKLINKYENHDRGWYAGPIGWVDKYGDGEFCVSLRSALIKQKSIQLFSGGGIVLNSNPKDEWEETELKLKTIFEIIKENIIND